MRKRVISVLLVLVCAAMVLALPVTAASPPAGSSYKLVLHLEVGHPMLYEKVPLAGVKYNLYKVGEFSSLDTSKTANGTYSYTPTSAFKNAGVEFTNLNFWEDGAEVLMGKAEKLAAYVADNKPSSQGSKTTNAKGEATFTGLSAGLYLALGDPVEKNYGSTEKTWTFTPQATLVAVPFWNPSGKWSTTVNIDAKATQDPEPGKEERVAITVKKVWADDNHPTSVTVELLADGEVFDGENATVVLNARNNWTYTWPNASSLYTWSVREEPISDWEATYTQKGNDFTITNRRVEPPPNDPVITPSPSPSRKPTTPSRGPTVTPSPSPSNDPSTTPTPTPSGGSSATPAPSGDPVPTPSNDPTTPSTPTPSATPTAPPPPADNDPPPPGDPTLSEDPEDPFGPPITSGTPEEPGTPGLPQTGQLWWPVPLLVVLGVSLLLIGAVLFVRKEEPEEPHE